MHQSLQYSEQYPDDFDEAHLTPADEIFLQEVLHQSGNQVYQLNQDGIHQD